MCLLPDVLFDSAAAAADVATDVAGFVPTALEYLCTEANYPGHWHYLAGFLLFRVSALGSGAT